MNSPALSGAAVRPAVPAQLGRYHVLFQLGPGDVGAVYAAAQQGPQGFEKVVALKVLPLAQEAGVAAAIVHPNVLPALEVFVVDGGQVIVMELVHGVGLDSLVDELARRGARLAPELAAWVVSQVADALHAVHELRTPEGAPAGLVHRCVSLHHVMLSFDGRVVLADCGLAKLVAGEPVATDGMAEGKLRYLAPEQLRGGALDRRCDVFALGTLLYEALASRPCFQGATPAELAQRVLTEQPDWRALSGVDAELASVASRCLQKDRDARPATAAEVKQSLHPMAGAVSGEKRLTKLLAEVFPGARERLEQRTVGARRLAATEATNARRVRIAWWAAGLAAVLALAAGLGFALRERPRPPEKHPEPVAPLAAPVPVAKEEPEPAPPPRAAPAPESKPPPPPRKRSPAIRPSPAKNPSR